MTHHIAARTSGIMLVRTLLKSTSFITFTQQVG
jgi:hypothetical protein